MDASQTYGEKLRKLYDRRKIGVLKGKETFNCEHFACCKAAAKAKGRNDLVKGAEAHVGKKYGDPIRLVVISHDTGGCEKDEYGADLCERRKDIKKTANCKKNPHMKGTIATLKHLYGCRPESDLLKRFAMTNSAKCSGKDEKKDSVPAKLYKNCRKHGLAELKELNPQLVVTQGGLAKDLLKCQDIQGIDEQEIRKHVPCSIWDDLYLKSWICKQLTGHLKYWKNGKQKVLVFQTTHPSAPGQWQLFEKTILPIAAYVIRQQLPCLDDFFRKPH